MADVSDSGLRAKHALLSPDLNERQRRLVAAADAQVLGRGGVSVLSRITGLSRTTLHKGLQELQGNDELAYPSPDLIDQVIFERCLRILGKFPVSFLCHFSLNNARLSC